MSPGAATTTTFRLSSRNISLGFGWCKVICSYAVSFFPTVESSFSEMVLYLRAWNGRDPSRKALQQWYRALQLPTILPFLLRENREKVDLTTQILRHIARERRKMARPR
eukprot:RCo016842